MAEDVKDATPQEVAAAEVAGATVKVQMPANVSSLSFDGKNFDVGEDGTVMLHIRHALHAVEAFGGRIVTEVKAALGKKK